MKRVFIIMAHSICAILLLVAGCKTLTVEEKEWIYVQIFVDTEEYFVQGRLEGTEFSPLFAPYEVATVYKREMKEEEGGTSTEELKERVRKFFSKQELSIRLWKIGVKYYTIKRGRKILRTDDVFFEKEIHLSFDQLFKENKLKMIIGKKDVYVLLFISEILFSEGRDLAGEIH